MVVRGGFSIYADDGKTPVADTCLTNSVPDNDEANARRLVACWNLLEGVPTAEIESSTKVTELCTKLLAQRDELLAALKVLHARYVQCIGNEGPEALAARAAIAKAEATQ